ncbi:ABC transporter permease [Mongoliimonas terrestris]|uniref:ABC transporter permease n=1 Tax=Mongoliimonas terrestris TaxID=1709001 RepID=UPI000949723D|nr:ABC transporter permease subunit [Mongoliimonas terrestris]
MELFSDQFNGYLWQMAQGAYVTLQLFAAGFSLALVIGVLVGIITLSKNIVIQAFWKVYSSIIMGVPSLLIIFLLYYGGSAMLSGIFGTDRSFDVTPFGAGVAALTIVYACYIAELVHGAVMNLPKGQFEACSALAIRPIAAWRHVILPQLTRLALPGLINIWMIVLKDTPLVSLAGLNDLVANAKIAAGATKEPFIFFIAASLFFIAFSALTLRLSARLETRFNRGIAEVKA